jgi:hypothetical protein
VSPELLQRLIVLTIVALAAAFLLRRVWRSRRPKSAPGSAPGCDSDCGCGH